MLGLAMIFWIGYTLSWFWWCRAIAGLIKIISFRVDMYKKDSEF